MALSEGEVIAIAVCVPLAIIILAIVGFLVWFKVLRVKTVNFKVSYVNEEGNIVTDEAIPPEDVVTGDDDTAAAAANGNAAGAVRLNGDAQQQQNLQQQQFAAEAQMQNQESVPGARPLPPGVF